MKFQIGDILCLKESTLRNRDIFDLHESDTKGKCFVASYDEIDGKNYYAIETADGRVFAGSEDEVKKIQ